MLSFRLHQVLAIFPIRYVDTFMSVLNKDFYFSHTYDITRTLQCNMLHGSVATDENAAEGGDDNRRANVPTFEEMFVWNHYLLETGFGCVDKRSPWTMPLIHGFIEQASRSCVCAEFCAVSSVMCNQINN